MSQEQVEQSQAGSGQGRSSSCSCTAAHLTAREIDILLYSAAGKKATQTARALGISPRTVEYHLAAMLRRTGSASSAELIARCYAAGILLAETWPPRWSGQLCVTSLPAVRGQPEFGKE